MPCPMGAAGLERSRFDRFRVLCWQIQRKFFRKADQCFFLAYDQFARLLLALLCLGDALAGDDNRS
jgi:hypothetical protein